MTEHTSGPWMVWDGSRHVYAGIWGSAIPFSFVVWSFSYIRPS